MENITISLPRHQFVLLGDRWEVISDWDGEVRYIPNHSTPAETLRGMLREYGHRPPNNYQEWARDVLGLSQAEINRIVDDYVYERDGCIHVLSYEVAENHMLQFNRVGATIVDVGDFARFQIHMPDGIDVDTVAPYYDYIYTRGLYYSCSVSGYTDIDWDEDGEEYEKYVRNFSIHVYKFASPPSDRILYLD